MISDFLILFLSVFYWGSPVGLADFWGHIGAVVISLSVLKKVSAYPIFWIIVFVSVLTAQESRFSLEYILFAITFFSVGLNTNWNNNEEKTSLKRKKILLLIFLLIAAFNLFKLDFSERGGSLLWFPVFLVLYYPSLSYSNSLIYLISGIALYLLNKFTTFVAFITSMRSKLVYLLSIFVFILYFIFKQKLNKFIMKSLEPRFYIWKSAWLGFLDKPLFGHGFGTFALDFPLYRTHAKVLGGRVDEQVAHGHSLLTHYGFELGLLGLVLLIVLFYLVYINAKKAILPLLIISLFDSTLVTFNQYLLAGLIIIPFIKDFGKLKFLFYKYKTQYMKTISFIGILILSLYVHVPSLVGHYYYSKSDLDNAIKWDNKNSLYYFTRGANSLNKDTSQSENDFIKAINLSSNVAFFHGFLGASQLANNKYSEAKRSLEKAMKLDGNDGYWCLLYSYANHDNKSLFEEYQKKALTRNPEIKELLSNSSVTSAQYIGGSKNGDSRLSGFYRTGEDIYFPLPVVE